jgi:hypothetical protein
VNPSVQFGEYTALVKASSVIQESVEFVDSGGLGLTDGFVGSQTAQDSSNLKPSVEWAESIAVGETGQFTATEAGIGTVGLKGTEALPPTNEYLQSQVFSASNRFTEQLRTLPRRRRSLMSLSGYLFFVFFYGDGI